MDIEALRANLWPVVVGAASNHTAQITKTYLSLCKWCNDQTPPVQMALARTRFGNQKEGALVKTGSVSWYAVKFRWTSLTSGECVVYDIADPMHGGIGEKLGSIEFSGWASGLAIEATQREQARIALEAFEAEEERERNARIALLRERIFPSEQPAGDPAN